MDFRTSGPWGAGSGADLTPAQVDANFYQMIQMIAAKVVTGVGIANIVVTGNELWVTLTDHALLGPYTLPVAAFTFISGGWQPNTNYLANSIFTEGGSTYITLVGMTSAATFDPGANNGMGQNYYGLLLQNAPNALPAGGTQGMVLTKFGSTDYVVTWTSPTLAGLFDVQQSPGPTTGQIVYWNGDEFSFLSPSDVVGAPPNLADLSDVLPSPAPTDGEAVVWSASAGKFIYGAVASSLETLSDVALNSGPFVGQILSFGGVNDWQNIDVTPYQAWTGGDKTLALTDVSNFIDYNGSGGDHLKLPISFASGSTIWVRQATDNAGFIVEGESGVFLAIPAGRIAQPRTIGSVVAIRNTSGGLNDWEIDGDLAYATPIALNGSSSGDTISPQAQDAEIFTLTPTASETIVCTNAAIGRRLTIKVTTSGTSSFTVTFGSGFISQGTLATGTVSGKVFVVAFMGDGTNMLEMSRTTAM